MPLMPDDPTSSHERPAVHFPEAQLAEKVSIQYYLTMIYHQAFWQRWSMFSSTNRQTYALQQAVTFN